MRELRSGDAKREAISLQHHFVFSDGCLEAARIGRRVRVGAPTGATIPSEGAEGAGSVLHADSFHGNMSGALLLGVLTALRTEEAELIERNGIGGMGKHARLHRRELLGPIRYGPPV